MSRSPQRLEYVFDLLKDKYSHYLIYIRADSRYHCANWDTDTEEAPPKCTDCLGMGYKITLEKWPLIDAPAMPTNQKAMLTQTGTIGRIASEGKVFYSQREMWPRKLDRLCEVQWSVPTHSVASSGRVIKLLDVYEINDVDSIRFKGGEIIFHQIYAKSLEADFRWMEDTLKGASFLITRTEYLD